MSDLFSTQTSTELDKRVCHVAYTMNNFQPVVSTIIGDEPLFYMDYECADDEIMDEDDGIFSAEALRHIENQLGALREDITSLEKFQQSFVRDQDTYIRDFHTSKNDMFGETKTKSSDTVLEILESSRLASSLLSFARMKGITVSFSDQILGAEYNAAAKTIMVSASLDAQDQVLLSIRELRRVWQIAHTGVSQVLDFSPDQAVFINRMQAVDLTVSMIRSAWELQLSGHRETWERVENSSLADLGRAFAREAFIDFRTINNGAACTAVFETWFLSERCRNEDKNIIQRMLSGYKEYTTDADQIPKTATPELIASFGAMPFGKNYLAKHAEAIILDPLFTDVRDRSNANFLWFIKFERVFKETEQELQSTGHLSTAADRAGSYQQKNEQEKTNDGMPADIIAFNTYERNNTTDHDIRSNGATGEVIYLRRWSAE